MLNNILWFTGNTTLIFGIIYFSLWQVQTPTYKRLIRFWQVLWFLVIAVSCAILFTTGFHAFPANVDLFFIRKLCNFLEIDVITIRVSALACWLGFVNLMHYKSEKENYQCKNR